MVNCSGINCLRICTHFCPSFVTDFTWANQIAEEERDVLFVAEGVFPYLKEAEVKQIIIFIQQKFLNSEIVMQLIGKFILTSKKDILSSEATSRFQWELMTVNKSKAARPVFACIPDSDVSSTRLRTLVVAVFHQDDNCVALLGCGRARSGVGLPD